MSKYPQEVADQAAQGAHDAIRATERHVNGSINRLADSLDEVRNHAAPIINRVASEAEDMARRGINAVRDRSEQIRDRAVRVQHDTVDHIRDEPIKAVLIAAATGALLVMLASMFRRS